LGNFNLSVLSTGGGGGSGSGIAKYATASALPGSAADGDVTIVLDTNNLYSYDTGVAAWVIIGGPGIAITVADTNSVDLDLTTNVLQATVRIPPGITGVPASHSGITLQIFGGASPGLVAFVQGFPASEVTSSVLQFSGNSLPVLGTTLGIQMNQSSGSTPGYLSAADWTTFNAKVGISAIIQTVFPILGGTNLPNSGGITLSIPIANGTTGGYLSSSDWNIFAKKLSGITGPVIATNAGGSTGSVVAVMQPGGITLSNLTGIDPNTFLGNPTGVTAGVTTITVAVAKSLLGISNNNFGDVTVGSFSYVSFAQGLTVSAAQVLQLGWGDTTNPGAVGPTHQVWAGDKRTTGNLGTDQYLQLRGGSLLSIGSTANAGHTLVFSGGQGGTYSQLSNNGLGILSWTFASPGFYRTITNAGATLAIQDRFVEVTTGATNQTLNVAWSSGNTGVFFYVTKIDSGLGNVIVQDPNGINGVTNFVFSNQWEVHKFVSNGVGLRVLS